MIHSEVRASPLFVSMDQMIALETVNVTVVKVRGRFWSEVRVEFKNDQSRRPL